MHSTASKRGIDSIDGDSERSDEDQDPCTLPTSKRVRVDPSEQTSDEEDVLKQAIDQVCPNPEGCIKSLRECVIKDETLQWKLYSWTNDIHGGRDHLRIHFYATTILLILQEEYKDLQWASLFRVKERTKGETENVHETKFQRHYPLKDNAYGIEMAKEVLSKQYSDDIERACAGLFEYFKYSQYSELSEQEYLLKQANEEVCKNPDGCIKSLRECAMKDEILKMRLLVWVDDIQKDRDGLGISANATAILQDVQEENKDLKWISLFNAKDRTKYELTDVYDLKSYRRFPRKDTAEGIANAKEALSKRYSDKIERACAAFFEYLKGAYSEYSELI
jgi:hypothetical protein